MVHIFSKRFYPLASAGFLFFISTVHSAVLPNIIVDQFGYQANAPKLVIFAQPVSGVGSPSSFTPGASFYLINNSGGATVYTGTVNQWNGGAVHTQSGDKAWQGDFSTYTTPGTYYIQVPGGSNPGAQSYTFQINNAVYNGVVTASQRMFFYQRCGGNISAGNGGANWNHTACHENANQDLAAHLWDNNADQGQARDIHGGWHDAGDYGKYITFAHATMWYLLHSAEWYPNGYPDNTNIPESANGVPDILDEVKWELDWMLRMQRASDGALYSMVGQTAFSTTGDPSTDATQRYYTNVSTTATATGAMAFALGARLFQNYPTYASYAVTLQNAAVSAWGYLQANTVPVTFNSTGISSANANQSASWDAQARVGAAAELFALTGNTTYRTYFDTNYNSAAVMDTGSFLPVHNPPNAGTDAFDATLSEPLQLGMVSYALAPGATASVVTAIQNAVKNECEWNILPNNPGSDPYMSYMYDGHYTWGSNQIKASWGNMCLFAAKLNVNPTHTTAYLNQAEEYLHYFHGRNPLNWVYLTNMGSKGANLGASNSIMSIYHSWFASGSTYDGNTGAGAVGPAPGILAGGPNQSFAPDASYVGTISPPQNEPAMKSYKDWGIGWPQDSWEVTEPDQGYQGKYQFLLSAFAVNTVPTPTPTASPTGTLATATFTPSSTPTASPTITPTPTATVCVLLFNGAETLGENGTWAGTNATRAIVTSAIAPISAITQGTHCLQAVVNTGATWNDQLFNLTGFAPTNWSTVTQIKMDINISSSLTAGQGWTQLFIRADSAPTTYFQPISLDTPTLVSGENLDVTFNINWAAGGITVGSPITGLEFVYNSGPATVTGTFYIDNIRLMLGCSTPTFTPTSTATLTPSRTPSATPTTTATLTATLTPTCTATATASSSPTNTKTSTPTFSSTSSPTFTLTMTSSLTFTGTPTNSPTGTITPPTLTFTPTVTATTTWTVTTTSTGTPTNTFANSPTNSVTSTNSSTPTQTASLTPTSSPAYTFTPTHTVSPTSTSTPTITYTGTPTMTQTATWTPTIIIFPIVQVSSGPISIPDSTQGMGTPNVPVLQVDLHNNSSSPVTVTNLTLQAAGSGNDSTGIASVQVYIDSNGSGTVDGGDILLGTGVYPLDNGTLTISFNDLLPALGSQNYLVVYNFQSTAPQGSYQVSITSLTVLTPPSGIPGTVSGLPLNGAVITVVHQTPTATVPPNSSVVLYPNPADGGLVKVLPPFYSGSSGIKIQMFTTAFRKVLEKDLGVQAYGSLTLDLEDDWGRPLSSGLYYAVIFTSQGRSISKLLILR